MIIRQPFCRGVAEINVRLEDIRVGDAPSNSPSLVAEFENHSARLDLSEQTLTLLEGRRTFARPKARVARLTKIAGPGATILSTDQTLCVRRGEPVAVINDKVEYSIADGEGVMTVRLRHPLSEKHLAGSFVQALTAWEPTDIVGISASLSKLDPLPAVAIRSSAAIRVFISLPITLGSIRYYDVYVRNCPVSTIGRHWWPDARDVSIAQDEVEIATWGGGAEGGGGPVSDEIYYVAVVSKDRPGFFNANESDASVFVVEKVLSEPTPSSG